MKRPASRRTWLVAGALCMSAMAAALALTDAPRATATLRGKVPVLQRKPPAPSKDYGNKPSIKVEPPDPPTSAVWLGSGAAPLDPASTPPARMEQRGYQFRPPLLIVQTGTPVVFPNLDSMYHSVFSVSKAKRFDLGRYRKGEEPAAVVFDAPGVVLLRCEVHDHMRASIIVVDTPWCARTDAEGAFQISGIPPGSYAVNIWLGPDKQVQQRVTLAEGQTLDVDWSDLAVPADP